VIKNAEGKLKLGESTFIIEAMFFTAEDAKDAEEGFNLGGRTVVIKAINVVSRRGALRQAQGRKGSQRETKYSLDLTQISLNPYCFPCVSSELRI